MIKYSDRAIKYKARKLAIKVLSRNKWTDEENQILKEKYPNHGIDIPELLNKHSKSGIASQARYLKLYRNKDGQWGEKEDQILREKYSMCGPNIPELLKTYNRKYISKKAVKLGIAKRKQPSRSWSLKEIEILKEKFPYYGTDIPELLKNHPCSGILSKASDLKIKKYSHRSTFDGFVTKYLGSTSPGKIYFECWCKKCHPGKTRKKNEWDEVYTPQDMMKHLKEKHGGESTNHRL